MNEFSCEITKFCNKIFKFYIGFRIKLSRMDFQQMQAVIVNLQVLRRNQITLHQIKIIYTKMRYSITKFVKLKKILTSRLKINRRRFKISGGLNGSVKCLLINTLYCYYSKLVL